MSNLKLGVRITTVSPTAIIEENESKIGYTLTKIKKECYFDENNEPVYAPYLPANGIRGLLRRIATKQLIDSVKANQNLDEINDIDIHAMLSGSGASDISVSYEKEKEIRSLNPLLSVLGTGLILNGKLKVANGVLEIEKKDKVSKVFTYVRCDDIVQKSDFCSLFSKEQIKNWEKHVLENAENRKEQREKIKTAEKLNEKIDEKKVKKETIQHLFKKEYIPSGLTFNSSISIENATKEEIGAILYALEEFLNKSAIGSSQNIGFGAVDIEIYDLEEDNYILMSSQSDENYIYRKNINMTLNKKTKEYYDAYQSFLKSATKENLEIISNL